MKGKKIVVLGILFLIVLGSVQAISKTMIIFSDPEYNTNNGPQHIPFNDYMVKENPDFAFMTGDMYGSGDKPAQWGWARDNISYVEENTNINKVWSALGNHDATMNNGQNGNYHWGGLKGWFQMQNFTSQTYCVEEGSMAFCQLGFYKTDLQLVDDPAFTPSGDNFNTDYYIPEPQLNWYKQKQEELCDEGKNIVVGTHVQLYETNQRSGDWHAVDHDAWRNSSKRIHNAIDGEGDCDADVLVTGHLHSDSNDFYSSNSNVYGGSAVWGSYDEDDVMNDETVYLHAPVVNFYHGEGNMGDGAGVYNINMTEGEKRLDLQAIDTSTAEDVQVGTTYNDTDTAVKNLSIPLDHEIEFSDSDSEMDEYSQSWSVSDVKYFNSSEVYWRWNGLWTDRSSDWIVSRWRYDNRKSFDNLTVDWKESSEGCCSLSHQFASADTFSGLDDAQWHNDITDVPAGKLWKVKTSISTSSSVLIQDMELTASDSKGGVIPKDSGNPFYVDTSSSDTGQPSVFNGAFLQSSSSIYGSWIVNATGDIGTSYNVSILANSSNPNVATVNSGNQVVEIVNSTEKRGIIPLQETASEPFFMDGSDRNHATCSGQLLPSATCWFSGLVNVSASSGSYDVNVFANSSNPNVAKVYSGNTTVTISETDVTSPTDNPPNVSLSLNATNVYENESVEASVSASDDFSVDSVALDWTSDGNFEENASGSTLTASRQFQSAGSYTVTARATDNNSQSSTDSVSLEVDPKITATNKSIIPTCTDAGSNDAFCVENSTNKETFTNGFTPEDNTTITMNVSPSVSSGTYTFFGFANSTGEHNKLVKSAKYDIQVSDSTSNTSNQVPFADFSISPSSPVAGEQITFDASSSSDSDGNLVAYRWDWTGDGTYEDTGETATHTYSSSGDYSVKLQVEDDDNATSTTTKTLTVGSNTTDDGDGSGGGGGGKVGDENQSAETVKLGNSTATLLSPHLDARYGHTYIRVNESDSKTVIIGGSELTIRVDQIQDTRTADIEVGGSLETYTENEQVQKDVIMADVVDTSSQQSFVLFSAINTIGGTVPFSYNYTTDDSINLSVQYRKTGIGNKWQDASKKTLASSSSGLDLVDASTDESIYEARIVLSNSTENKTTDPVGFIVGQAPDIDVTKPNQGEDFYRSPNPTWRLPINFKAATINKTTFGAFYRQQSTGTTYNSGEVTAEPVDDSITLFDLFELSDTYSPFADLIENEYGLLSNIFGVPEDVTFEAEVDVRVPGTAGDYTAYVNATDNSSLVNFTATSIGKTANVFSLDPETQTVEDLVDSGIVENSTVREYNKSTNAQKPQQDENVSKNITTPTQSGVFEKPYWSPEIPASNSTYTPKFLIDLETGKVPFLFTMGHEGNVTLNRTVVVEKDNKTVKNISIVPDTAYYNLDVQAPGGKWEAANYTWYVQFENNGSVVYSTENNLQGEMTFQIKENNIVNKCSNLELKEKAICYLNPNNYSQMLQYMVTLGLVFLAVSIAADLPFLGNRGITGAAIAAVLFASYMGWVNQLIGTAVFILVILWIGREVAQAIAGGS